MMHSPRRHLVSQMRIKATLALVAKFKSPCLKTKVTNVSLLFCYNQASYRLSYSRNWPLRAPTSWQPTKTIGNNTPLTDSNCWCQPRGHCASVDDRGAGSECSVLIYYGHNSHSLFSYTVDLEVVDHGHVRLAGQKCQKRRIHFAKCLNHISFLRRSGLSPRTMSTVSLEKILKWDVQKQWNQSFLSGLEKDVANYTVGWTYPIFSSSQIVLPVPPHYF